MKAREELKDLSKAEILRQFKEWLSPEKFNWLIGCKCWDGLLLNWATGEKNLEGGCLFRKQIHADVIAYHLPLISLGFSMEELRDLEYLIRWFDGERMVFYDNIIDEDNSVCKDIEACLYYDNGIQYLEEWIAHLESQETPVIKETGKSTEVKEVIKYRAVAVDSRILDKAKEQFNKQEQLS